MDGSILTKDYEFLSLSDTDDCSPDSCYNGGTCVDGMLTLVYVQMDFTPGTIVVSCFNQFFEIQN